jgi:hypothetical protein
MGHRNTRYCVLGQSPRRVVMWKRCRRRGVWARGIAATELDLNRNSAPPTDRTGGRLQLQFQTLHDKRRTSCSPTSA